jgi:ABC-type nitrate/sulfonate/bicarbonate transport system permease component
MTDLVQSRVVEQDQVAAATTMVRRSPVSTPEQARRRRRRNRTIELVLGIGAPIVMLLAWQICSDTKLVNPQFFPPPTRVWRAGIALSNDGSLWTNLWISLQRVLVGSAMGVGAGIVAGVALGTSRWCRVALEPLLSALYTVPKLAIFPLLLLIFGLNDTALDISIAITVFFFMWISTMTAFLAVSPGYREVADTFNAGRWQMFRHVLLPAALPQMFIGLRLSLGVAVLMMVGVEFSQSNSGIGHLIWYSWSLFRPSDMYVGIIATAVMGLVLSSVVKWVSLAILPWARTEILGGDLSVV